MRRFGAPSNPHLNLKYCGKIWYAPKVNLFTLTRRTELDFFKG